MSSQNQELEKIDARIEELFNQWKNLQPLKPEDQERFDKKVRLDWNFHSNKIEGNTLTYNETKALLDEGKEEGIHPSRDYKEIKAHDLAINKVKELAKDKERKLNEVTIRDLNQIILKEPFWKDTVTPDGQKTKKKIIPGQYKTQPNHVITEEGKPYKFAEPHDVPIKMQDLMNWFHKEIEQPTLSIASFIAHLHHKFIVIHPFDDGNGRVTRLWMNYVLLKLGYPPLAIKSEDKRNYFAALQRADNADIDSLAIYLGKALISWLEIGIKAAKGEDISEMGDVDKEVDLFIRERTGKVLNEPLSKESAINLIDSLDTLFKTFKNRFKKFNQLFNHNTTKQYIHLHPLLQDGINMSEALSPVSQYGIDRYKITFTNGEDIKRELGLLEDRDVILSRHLSSSSPLSRLSNLLGYSDFASYKDILRHVSICIDLSYHNYEYDENLEEPFDIEAYLYLEMDTSKYKIGIIFNNKKNEKEIYRERYYNQLLTQKEVDIFIEQGKKEFLKLLKSEMIQKIHDLLKEFREPTGLMELDIYDKISCFIRDELKGKKLNLNSESFYELIAFRLMMAESEQCDLEGWEGLIYAPIFSTRDENGGLISDPDIKDITFDMVDYWEKRCSEVDNYPILQCRYAGLVWSFSKKIRGRNPDISFAHKLIDSAKAIASLSKNKSEKAYMGHIILKLKNALKTAIAINDNQRILSIKDTIIEYEITHAEDHLPGTWGHSFDILIGKYKKVQLIKEQEDKIIKELERRLEIFSKTNSKLFRPDVVEDIVTKLAPYYKEKGDKQNMNRVLMTYKDSCLYGNFPAIIKGYLLEKVRKILLQYNLSQDVKELEPHIRKHQENIKNEVEFKKASAPIKIPSEIIDNYKNELDKRTLSEALDFIAIRSIPDEKQSEEIAKDIANKNIFINRITQTIVDDKGRKIAEVGPIEKDLKGHTIRQFYQAIEFKYHFLNIGLKHLMTTKSLNANALSEHLLRAKIFPEKHHLIIKEGINAFFEKKHITCCSVLISQIEMVIRELVSGLGGEVYQIQLSKEKGFQLKPLGALLRDERLVQFLKKINKNIPTYFQILLTDNRGFNLRNSIYHSNSPSYHFNEFSSILIINALLILSISAIILENLSINVKQK